jgi:hypothetical protein
MQVQSRTETLILRTVMKIAMRVGSGDDDDYDEDGENDGMKAELDN